MHGSIILGVLAGLTLGSCGVPAPPDPPALEWAKNWDAKPAPPPPPPGGHDAALEKLPQPLSPADATRVLVEATIYAPWGFGLGGRPMQAFAINVLLEQPRAAEVLEAIYQQAETPGRLLALCALSSADPERFARLAKPLGDSRQEVATYSGCIGIHRTAAEVLSEMTTSSTCSDIPRSKERIVVQFKPAG